METVKKTQLFNASCVALVVTALAFATRGSFVEAWATEFNLTHVEVGWIVGTAFWGFTLAMVFGGPLVDIIGIGRIIAIAFFCHVAGIVLTIIATGFWSLFISTLLIGIANGSVEAACNPLVTTLFPEKKTKMLNRFHVWFPGGIVIGSLLAWFVMDQLNLPWQALVSLLFVPLALYGFLFFGQPIPETERVAKGVTYKEMMRNVGAPVTITLAVIFMILVATNPAISAAVTSSYSLPLIIVGAVAVAIIIEGRLVNKITLLFPFIFFCMLLTASTELGTTQWLEGLLARSVDRDRQSVAYEN